jgi:hypothetical protein
MLFNLTTHASFPCIKPSYAIECSDYKGPDFGNGELSANSQPFNKEYACISFTNGGAYSIPRNSEGINMLTNMKCNSELDPAFFYFTITELEVWGVSFND